MHIHVCELMAFMLMISSHQLTKLWSAGSKLKSGHLNDQLAHLGLIPLPQLIMLHHEPMPQALGFAVFPIGCWKENTCNLI